MSLLAKTNKGLLCIKAHLPTKPYTRRVYTRRPQDKAQSPDLFPLGVSVAPLVFRASFHSHWERIFQSVLPAGIGTNWPPAGLQRASHPWDCSLVVYFGGDLQSFCVFLSVDLFMMASYCLHWKLLTLASGRALSSEPPVWTGRLEWWPVSGGRVWEGQGERPHRCVRAQSLYSSKDPIKGPTAWQLHPKHCRHLSSGGILPFWASSHHSPAGAHPTSFPS